MRLRPKNERIEVSGEDAVHERGDREPPQRGGRRGAESRVTARARLPVGQADRRLGRAAWRLGEPGVGSHHGRPSIDHQRP